MRQTNIPLYDEAEKIARRIHEKTLDECGKIKPRVKPQREPKSTASRPLPGWRR